MPSTWCSCSAHCAIDMPLGRRNSNQLHVGVLPGLLRARGRWRICANLHIDAKVSPALTAMIGAALPLVHPPWDSPAAARSLCASAASFSASARCRRTALAIFSTSICVVTAA